MKRRDFLSMTVATTAMAAAAGARPKAQQAKGKVASHLVGGTYFVAPGLTGYLALQPSGKGWRISTVPSSLARRVDISNTRAQLIQLAAGAIHSGACIPRLATAQHHAVLSAWSPDVSRGGDGETRVQMNARSNSKLSDLAFDLENGPTANWHKPIADVPSAGHASSCWFRRRDRRRDPERYRLRERSKCEGATRRIARHQERRTFLTDVARFDAQQIRPQNAVRWNLCYAAGWHAWMLFVFGGPTEVHRR